MNTAQGHDCTHCAVAGGGSSRDLVRLGIELGKWDYVIALAGNPNTGKSTVFNNLTGLRQHTGNWPGKTVARAEGGFLWSDKRFKVVDLPGTYSLLSMSEDEEIAREFILFGRPDVTVVVVDATRLERNLNLVLQILEITDRVVVCLNLMDEAADHGIDIDVEALEAELGVPVVPAVALRQEGMPQLLDKVHAVATGARTCKPRRAARGSENLERPRDAITEAIRQAYPDQPNARWLALRLLEGDAKVEAALRGNELDAGPRRSDVAVEAIFQKADEFRWSITSSLHDVVVQAIYEDASSIIGKVVRRKGEARRRWEKTLDGLLTSRWTGFPIMLALLATVFWITVQGANVPSAMINGFLIGKLHPLLKLGAAAVHLPWWLDGLLIDGFYLATAWVIAVMLPPMAIFFPMFTLLEDFGYLPRVAYNLDRLFRASGAHGKQALTLSMGFGCNAAGIVATRVIDSPRERLIAIITNNFALCNGRWPTQILLATIFVGALVPPAIAGLVSAAAVVGVALFGVFLTFVVSWLLSRTVLKGEASSFSLELPPYRRPRFLRTLYTSLIDRTIYVLWRAVVFAMPAGAAIWLIGNIHVAGGSVAEHLIRGLDPVGVVIGLNGVIMLAYVVAIPANEIVVPTILMLTVMSAGLAGQGAGAGVMFELDDPAQTLAIFKAGGWTLLTAINLMLFSLLHNPCSTTLYTIWKETGRGWVVFLSAAIPLTLGFGVCFIVAQAWRMAGLPG